MEKEFFNRNAEIVARELLGKVLVREIEGRGLKARIVETEAYFDENDPASRACQNGDLRETMMMEPGVILIYGVHNNWMFNFVTDEKGIASAVLIRAIEPLNFEEKCNGPGLLTKALKIGKDFHKKSIFGSNDIWIEDDERNKLVTDNTRSINSESSLSIKKNKIDQVGKNSHVSLLDTKDFEIERSFRIGVKKDLDKPMRFFVKDSKWVSRK